MGIFETAPRGPWEQLADGMVGEGLAPQPLRCCRLSPPVGARPATPSPACCLATFPSLLGAGPDT